MHHDLEYAYQEQGNKQEAIKHLMEFVRLAFGNPKLQNMIPGAERTIQRLESER